jgi:hypothetical protein
MRPVKGTLPPAQDKREVCRINAEASKMPFPDSRSADIRLVGDATPLTEEEIRDLLPWVRVLSNAARERLQAELSLIQLAAMRRQEQLTARQFQSFAEFDRSTSRANRWMIGFTAAVTIMTLVILVATLYPVLHEHSNSVTPQADTKQAIHLGR